MHTFLALLIVALATSCAPLASAAPAKAPNKESGTSDPTLSRGTPLPAWAQPLAEAPSTQREDPVVLRLNEVQARVGAVPAVLRNRVIQVNERSSLARIGQFSISYLPKHQKLSIHKVAILRGAQVMDRTATVNIRMLDREQALENGVYGGARTAQMLMDDVRVGDALWVVYSIEGENPVFGHAWSDGFAMEADEPIELARLTVMHPKDKALYWRQLGDFRTEAVKPVIEKAGQLELMRFELRGVDAVEVEANVSPDYFPIRVIQFSEYADWHGVAGWAAGLFPSVSRSPELDKLVATFRKEPSAEAQASAALQWVQDEIRYFSVSIGENSHRPMAPDAVLKRRFGDCKDKSYLLTSILNRLGIAAKPVLVNAQSRKLPGKVLPAPTWFDHAIVRLELDGKPYFVDPTRSSERGPISKRPAVLAGGAGLIVDAGSTSLESLPVERFELPSFDIAEKIAVASMDGAGVLASQYTYRAHAANWARQHYTGMSEREVRNELLATMEKQYPGASLQGKTKMVDNEAENTYVVTAEYRLPKPVSKHDGLYAIEYDSKILSSSLQVPGKLTRNFPLALTPSHQRYRLQIDWPADVRATGSSITQEVDNAHFNTHEEYTVLGNRTDLLIDHTVHSSEVAAAEVPDLQVAWKKVYPMMEASFRVPEGFVVDAEARTVPLRHVAAVRSAITNAERIRQSSAKFSGGNRGLKEFCEPTVDAVDLRRIAPSFDELLKEVTTGLEKHPMEPGVRRCLAMLDFAWGDFERALSYYEADGPLDDDDALVDQLAWARLLAGDVQGAIQANQRFVAARRKLGKLSTYDLASTLALYARAKIQAPAELRMLAGRFGDGPWPRPVLAYQLGTLKEADLLGMAGKQDPDQRDRMLSDAWFYIAQQRYAQGDGIGGVAALKWVSIHGIFGTPPLHQALGELWHADYGDKDYRNAQIALENGDKKKALELHQLAAARGHGGSLEALGHMYENGNGVSKDMARAIELYRSAAALGRTNAMNSLGVIYSEGNGVAADQVIAVDWLMKAAAVGDYYASRNIGWRHRRGIDAAWDGARARQFLTDSAELGNSEAQGELADVYLNGEDVPIDYMLAHYWARHAAESGDAHGKSILAYLYANGYGGVKANLPHAIALWQEAAKDRDTMAQFQLGLAYSKGRGVPMNLRKARELLAVAASNGNHYARLYLNNLIMTDDPSSSEAKRVITLFTKLAENGMTQAAEFLSEYYTKGIGVPKDAVAGAHWAQVATSKVKAPSTEQAAQGQP